MPPHPLTNFEIHKYYKMNQDLMVLFLEIIYLNTIPLKNKGWDLYNKS